MALVLQLLPLLLSRAQGDAAVPLVQRPGDRVNLSCVGISNPIRWAWAPSFPTCKGLSKGRRPILWASSSGTPTVSPVQPFAGRLRVLDPGIRRLELLLSAGDSGTFICRGRHEDESRTVLHVLGDGADCRAPGPSQGRSKPPSASESRAPKASKGGGGQDCRRPGPGAEPAVCGPGSYGPQKAPPVVASGPC
ncbi:megakaryocyte and platelet inhibitory receptor G6b isoform X2 [Pteronotus mesoamericanus]|uniref:megakaryocyte and platelet inhibitory receptor G6b isoform X2 n=1 Tax=Pteronotus mesoamericanus TaxID=1884717 RepID=UPI0023EC79C7|nr:megakaryocyte and platelet inhibitory receptor G6b isoform X2 [Pteronotus parnellii mesoamericanus]